MHRRKVWTQKLIKIKFLYSRISNEWIITYLCHQNIQQSDFYNAPSYANLRKFNFMNFENRDFCDSFALKSLRNDCNIMVILIHVRKLYQYLSYKKKILK